MSTVTIRNVVQDSAGHPVPLAVIHITLRASLTGNMPGYVGGASLGSAAKITADRAGAWSADLVPNGEIVPMNSWYEVIEDGYRSTIIVPPSGGPYNLSDVLVDVSTPLTPPFPSVAYVDGAKAAAIATSEAYTDTSVGTETAARATADSTEAAARAAGDTATLTSAHTYADGAVASEASARTSGDSATLASAEGYADASVAGEASARVAGDALKVAKAGDTMTGPLVLPADPTTSLQASTKQYVDAAKTTAEGYADTAVAGEASTRASADTAEVSARTTGDAATLTSAESYADSAVAVEATARASAVTAEAGARASGDTSTLASAHSYTDSSVASEAGTRAAADTAEASARTTGDASTLSSANTYADGAVAGEASARTAADALLVPKTRSVATTAPLTGGGDLSADRPLGVSGATTGAVGVVQLAGDLAGTATAPTVPGLATEAAARVAGDALALQKNNNLSDVVSPSTALGNLGGAPLLVGGKGVVREDELVVNVEQYAVGNANYYNSGTGHWYSDAGFTSLATDDTAAIRALVAGGAKHLWFGSKQYRVKWTEQTILLSWANAGGVTLRGNGANLCDETVYSNSPTDPYTSVFDFNACTNVTVDGVGYIGPPIPNPTVNHGYWGATFVRAWNGSNNVRVDATVSNLRYGVESGSYATPSDGYNKNFNIRLRATWCAYPQAHYLAEGIVFDIEADSVHRVSYLAGCISAKGTARWKDEYIADTCFLITDAMTGTGTSRGCSSLDVVSIDKGSTVFQPSTACAGLGLSRVNPGIVYEDIKVRVESTSTDTISSTVGGFKLYSGAASLTTPPAPYNWEPTIYLRNIEVSGTLDHSAQTVDGNTAGDIFVRAWDTTTAHAATVDNLSLRDLIVLPSSGNTRLLYLEAPGVVNNGLQLRNVQAPNSTLQLVTSTTVPTSLINSNLLSISEPNFGCRLLLIGSNLGSLTGTIGLTDTISSAIGGAGVFIRQKTTTLALSGTAVSWASALPGGSLPLAVSGYVEQAVTGTATGFKVGIGTDPGRYCNTNTLTQGFSFTPSNQAVTEQTIYWNGASSLNINVAAKGGSFSGGQIRLSLTYLEFPAPTS